MYHDIFGSKVNLSAFSDVETQISKIKIENEVDSLKNYISLQGRVQIHFFQTVRIFFGLFFTISKKNAIDFFLHYLQIIKMNSKNCECRLKMNSLKS